MTWRSASFLWVGGFFIQKKPPHSAVVLIWTFCAAHQPPKFPDFTCYTTFFPFSLRWHRRHRCGLSPAQTDPHADVVGQASPQRLHPYLAPSAHAELAQPELRLDPQIGRLRHLRPLAINLARLFALHLVAEFRHFGYLFAAMDRSSRHPIARTALAFDRTSLAIRPLRSIPIAHLRVPLFFPLIGQRLSLRTTITVGGLIIDKLRAVILRTDSAPLIGTLTLARLIPTGPDELYSPLPHRHYIVPADKPTIGDHLIGSLAKVLLHSVDPRFQLFKVVTRLHHPDRYHHCVGRIRVDLNVIARRKTAVRLLHHPRLRVSRAHPSVLFVLATAFFGQLFKFL